MMFLRVALCLVLGSALGEYGQKCIDLGKGDPPLYTTERNTEILGDKYQQIEQQDLQGCADHCAADPKCLIWSHEVPTAMAAWCNIDPGLPGCNFDAKGDCYLSSIDGDFGHLHYGYCHGKKYTPPPTPPPAPPSPPAPAPTPGAQHHWAVIMAGSNTYANYRHQADACHAYQIAKKNGIPEENIILLAYDDIVNNTENPFPGKMFNKPDGPDVYEGCKISYKGAQVNKANFLKVLTGDTSASGPVLKSTSKDRVFVYYADHGGVGILGVPDGAAGGYIHAKEVNDALDTMHSKGMYAELLFYLEACESGSIFKGLLNATNVLAVTAANADESSYGSYCPPQDKVNNKRIGSCLGDEFSIRWMEDTDVGNTNSETVKQQIDTVTQAVKGSHVQHFGDITGIGAEVIGDFEGSSAIAMDVNVDSSSPFSDNSSEYAVNSRDVEVHLAYYRMKRAETLEQRRATQKQLTAMLARRQAAEDKFMQIAVLAAGGNEPKAQAMIDGDVASLINVNCHFDSLQIVAENCGAFDDYTMRYSRLFANLCDMTTSSLAQITDAVQKVCNDKPHIVV